MANQILKPTTAGPASDPAAILEHMQLILGLAIAAGMEAFVSSAVSLALPRIAADFSASPDEISWAVTLYLVGFAIALPGSAWCATQLGQKKFLSLCVAGYIIASIGCALTTLLPTFLAMRLIQGAAGASFVARALFTFTKEFRPPALIYVLFVLVGSFSLRAIGLPIGGLFIDEYSWRWIFWITAGVLSLAALPLLLLSREVWPRSEQKGGDYMGFVYLVAFFGALLIALGRGQREAWSASPYVVTLLTAAAFALFAYIWREVEGGLGGSILPLRLLALPQMAIGATLSFFAGFMLTSGLYVLPQFLLGVVRWDSFHVGLLMSIDSFGLMAGIAAAAWTLGKFMTRTLVVASGLLFSLSMILLASRMSAQTPVEAFYLPSVLRGFAVGLALPPIGIFSFIGIASDPRRNGQGRAWQYTIRQLGAVAGMAFVVWWLDQRLIVHSSHLGQSLSLGTSPASQYLSQVSRGLSTSGLSPFTEGAAANLLLSRLVAREASILAYQDTFGVLALIGVLVASGGLLLPRVRKSGPAQVPQALELQSAIPPS